VNTNREEWKSLVVDVKTLGPGGEGIPGWDAAVGKHLLDVVWFSAV